MQTILGSGGAIGIQLAKALPKYTDKIRLVSRNPKKVNPGDELFSADLTDADAVSSAVKGSEVAYLTAGLVYKTKVWQASWPKIMNNVISACLQHNCKLVFFDNIYMYDGSRLNPITESTPINPPSEKGKVRAKIVGMIDDAKKKGLVALIARSADFYGPSIHNVSVLTETVIKPLSEGKTANWLGDDTKKHSYTYVPDAAKATALLGNTPEAYGEVWHLPTAKNPPTGKEWVEMIAAELGVKPKYRVVGKGMVKFLGLFMSIMKESVEMMYQNDRDYVFDSSKFDAQFDIKPTPYKEGVRLIVQTDYPKAG